MVKAGTVPVDGHVHFHPCFSALTFLECAYRHLGQAHHAPPGMQISASTQIPGILFLCSIATQEPIDDLTQQLNRRQCEWEIQGTSERAAHLVMRHGAPALTIIVGRQLVSAEGLEVLAIGTCDHCPERLPLPELLDWITGVDAVAILPWGLGKWWFQRGRHLRALIERLACHPDPNVFFGDQSGRPRSAVRSSPLAAAHRQGIRVLAGTDPLSTIAEVSRVGRFGFWLEMASLDETSPARSIKHAVRNMTQQPRFFGQRDALPQMLVRQIRWRLSRH